ncbi:MAG: ferritin-like domain-containing protein [Actinomycetales bacterium]
MRLRSGVPIAITDPRERVERSVAPGLIARRRFLLLAAGAPVAFAAACSSPTDPGGQGSPDDQVRSEVAAAELALIAQYQSTIAAFPDLGASLMALAEQHRAHLAAMGDAFAGAEIPSGQQTTPIQQGSSAQQAVAALAEVERAAAQQRRQSCLDAQDPGLARTLAFIAASEASHVPALGQVPT